jgi:threonine dehydratase
VASWYAANPAVPRATLICVEPYHAACLMESARAGHAVAISGALDTIMGGLRCGEASPAALPAVLEGYDAYLAIDDVWTRRAMLRLARPAADERPIASGASGAAGLAALMALHDDPTFAPVREALGIGERTRAMVLVTEGVTEPELYEEVVGGGGRARQR